MNGDAGMPYASRAETRQARAVAQVGVLPRIVLVGEVEPVHRVEAVSVDAHVEAEDLRPAARAECDVEQVLVVLPQHVAAVSSSDELLVSAVVDVLDGQLIADVLC